MNKVKMKLPIFGIVLGAMLIITGAAAGQPVTISNVQVQQQGDLTAVLVSGSGPLDYEISTSEPGAKPYRVYLDVRNAVLREPVIRDIGSGPVKRVNGAQLSTQPSVVRFAIESERPVTYQASTSGSMLGIALQAGEPPALGPGQGPGEGGGPRAPEGRPGPEGQPQEREIAAETVPGPAPAVARTERPAANVVRASSIDVPSGAPMSLKSKLEFMRYREASIISVLRAFAEQYNLNIVIAKDVADDLITVRLQDVSLEGALDAILTANGYNFVKRENIILVKSRSNRLSDDMATEIFKLEYLNANDVLPNLVAIKSEFGIIQRYQPGPIGTVGVSLPVTGQMGGLFGAGGGGAAGGGGGGTGAGGPVAETDRASVLIITETPEVLEKMRGVIRKLDSPVPQVRIEVKLIETKLNDNDRWGINWSTPLETVGRGGQPTGVSSQGQQGGGGAAGGAGGQSFVEGVPLYLTKYKFGTLSFAQFRAVMEFLESRGDTKLLNQPSITVIDNQQADIAIGSVIPIEVTQLITQGGAGGGGGGGGAAGQQGAQTIVQQQPVTISLTVIPRVNEDRYVTLWVQPQVNEISGYTGRNADLPITSLRSANTQVRIRDGETVVIGGLIKEDKIRTERRVKFLNRLPLFGRLFKHVSLDEQKSELIMFITPYIIRNNEFLTQSQESNVRER